MLDPLECQDLNEQDKVFLGEDDDDEEGEIARGEENVDKEKDKRESVTSISDAQLSINFTVKRNIDSTPNIADTLGLGTAFKSLDITAEESSESSGSPSLTAPLKESLSLQSDSDEGSAST